MIKLIILSISMIILFPYLTFQLQEQQTQTNLTQQNITKTIENPQIILEQMNKNNNNNSTNEILKIQNENELIQNEKLKKANKKFIEITTNQTENISNNN